MPIGWVIKGKCMLALHRGVCWGLFVNAHRDPVNQQFAPLYVCPGSEESHQLRERRLNGGSEDVGGIFELGDGHGRAPNDDQVALRSPLGGRNLDIGMVGGLDKGIIVYQDQRGRGHTSLGVKVDRSSGVGKGNNKTSSCRKPRCCSCGSIRRSGLGCAFGLRWRLGLLLLCPGAHCLLSH